MNLISTLKMTALSTALLLAGCSSNTTTTTTSSTKSIKQLVIAFVVLISPKLAINLKRFM